MGSSARLISWLNIWQICDLSGKAGRIDALSQHEHMLLKSDTNRFRPVRRNIGVGAKWQLSVVLLTWHNCIIGTAQYWALGVRQCSAKSGLRLLLALRRKDWRSAHGRKVCS